MTRLVFGAALVFAGRPWWQCRRPRFRRPGAPARGPAPTPAPSFQPPQTFQRTCFECHGGQAEGRSQHRAAGQAVRRRDRRVLAGLEPVAEMLESGKMPPHEEATLFPTDDERAAAGAGFDVALEAYEAKHAGDPGRVTVRRLTSAEYAYALRDLTGLDIKVGIDASSDSVGGEGFTNFGDVQFVQDASIERYLEAAKHVADHAVIGAGPLEFYRRSRQDGPGAVGPEPDQRPLRVARVFASSRAKADGRSDSSGTARRSSSRGTTSIASRWATPQRRSRPRGEGRHHGPLRGTHLDRGEQGDHRAIRRARPSTAG